MSLESIQIPHFPSSLPIYAALYRDVQNAPYLRQQLVSANSDFEYAFIDASMIYSRAHALAAVFRGVNDYLNNRLRTHNVHAEIVVSLSPTNNIADSYRKFGITDSTTDLLVFKIPVTSSITYESVSAHLGESVQGSLVAFNDDTLSEIADVAKIKKAYKLGSLPSQPAKTDQLNGHDDGRRQLEICLLGAIALRGAT